MRFKCAIALVLTTVLIISSISVYSANISDLQNKKNQVQQKMNTLDKKIDKLQEQRDDLGDQIEAINKKISGVQDSLDDINAKLAANQTKLNEIISEVDIISKKQAEQESILKDRLIVYYENGGMNYLDILLNSKNFSDMLARYEVIKQIIGFDKGIMDEMQIEKDKLDVKKKELEVTKTEIADQKSKVVSVKREFEAAKGQKGQLMAKLTDEQRKIEREYEQEEQASNSIARQILQMQGGGSKSPYIGGKLQWPSPGYYNITSPFGWRVHPVLRYKKMHNGIDVGVPSGGTIVAANDGVVSIASYQSGYGNVVTIDHGGGISTLYAHNSSLVVSVGQKVKRGQTVSKAGSTGISTGPHLHFEVRQNGAPIDPMPWLR